MANLEKDKIVDKFIELVEIDSVSKHERNMADSLKNELNKLGFIVEEDKTGEKINGNAGNIIAKLDGDDSLPTILLSAHMDRVKPGKGVKTKIKDGYIYSKGDTVLGGDDMIGVLSIIEAVKNLQRENFNYPNIIVVFSVAEEIGLLGAKNLDSSYIEKADYGIVIDADGNIGKVINKAPGQNKFNAVIKGKAAHAGMEPEKGVNAIKIASHAISKMKVGRIDFETTANIGVIRGGSASNIVPDVVELEGEVRSHNEEKLFNQTQEMKSVLNKYTEQLKGNVEFDIERLYDNFEINKNEHIIKIVKKAAKKTNLPFELTSSGGGSDANIFNKKGLSTINLGSAMENVHSTDERIKISNLLKLIKYLINIIKTF